MFGESEAAGLAGMEPGQHDTAPQKEHGTCPTAALRGTATQGPGGARGAGEGDLGPGRELGPDSSLAASHS